MSPFLAGLFLLTTSSQDKTYDMLWHPTAGQHLVYDLKVEGEVMTEPFVFKAEVHQRVKKVEANGNYQLGTQFTNGYTKFGTHEDHTGDDPEEVQKYNKRGELLDKKQPSTDPDDDNISELVGQATDFSPPMNPVKLNDSWTKEIAADKSLSLPAASATYKLSAESKFGEAPTLVVTYTYAQKSGLDPMKAKGVIVLDARDGSIVSVNADVDNLPLAEGTPPGKAKLSMFRKKTS